MFCHQILAQVQTMFASFDIEVQFILCLLLLFCSSIDAAKEVEECALHGVECAFRYVRVVGKRVSKEGCCNS